MYWGIVVCTHLELIGWLKALNNLWHGFAAVSMGEFGTCHFLSTLAPKTNAEIHGMDSYVVVCFDLCCSGPLVDTDMLHVYLKGFTSVMLH